MCYDFGGKDIAGIVGTLPDHFSDEFAVVPLIALGLPLWTLPFPFRALFVILISFP